MRKKYNWNAIQRDYDNGLTWRGIQQKYGCANASIAKAVKRGDLCVRNKSNAMKLHIKKAGPLVMTDEIKKKISKSMVKYFEQNPDKVPFRVFHSSTESYPEKIFRMALEKHNIKGWTQHYQNGIYEYDFAFHDKKLDVEIDGNTHLAEQIIKKDARRDEWSRKNGWTVIRFRACEVKEDVDTCISKLQLVLHDI